VAELNVLLSEGMYVRFSSETKSTDTEFRDFKIGQITKLDQIANTATVKAKNPAAEKQFTIDLTEKNLDDLERCMILPHTSFVNRATGKRGRILHSCTSFIEPCQLLTYFVQMESVKEVQVMSEALLEVNSNRQNVDPYEQLRQYEFHNPGWRTDRDLVVEGYSQLRNATYGIEDLVGSRVMLLAHQAEVISRVLADPECRYILADEVGLGKTIEACVILKGLLRRDPSFKTLIIAPASLVQQWYNELDAKFWLKFRHVNSLLQLPQNFKEPGIIVSVESLIQSQDLRFALRRHKWGLLIVDEAHNIYKSLPTYAGIRKLSESAERVLLLSATPIQRRTEEYLKLLGLLEPQRYNPQDIGSFRQMLGAQENIRRRIAYLSTTMTPETFDAEEFSDEISSVVEQLVHDQMLAGLVAKVSSPDAQPLQAAKEVLAYVSQNYRVESRLIRNRRVNLNIKLPTRQLDASYSYTPGDQEAATLDALYTYLEDYNNEISHSPLAAEYCRVLLHAAYSSPAALLDLLKQRLAIASSGKSTTVASADLPELLHPAAVREEAARLSKVVAATPLLDYEAANYLDRLAWLTERWLRETTTELDQVFRKGLKHSPTHAHRLLKLLKALAAVFAAKADAKVLVFANWLASLDLVYAPLAKLYGKETIARFTCRQTAEDLQAQADYFQEDPRCRILLSDELGGEGRNFQMADAIIHLDLPWTPAQVEQRIGRVDRLGRQGDVLSIVLFAQDWPEQDLYKIWQEAFELFNKSMSGLEIALEGIQDELTSAVVANPRNGVSGLLEKMVTRVAELRAAVEDERYFEEIAINYDRRADFQDIIERYQDGKLLRKAFLGWAYRAGLYSERNSKSDILMFKPKQFNLKSMAAVRLFDLADMREALHRSGRIYNYVIRGTFNRDVAIRQENLIFFAPGNNWTDMIINNAIEADRGRCCAIARSVPELPDARWEGVEFFYSLAVNPRPLYAAGYDATHLFDALGFLQTPTYRVLVSADGEIIERSNPLWKMVEPRFSASQDRHLGKRSGSANQITAFKEAHPEYDWHSRLESLFETVQNHLNEELSFMEDLAEEARAKFERRLMGLRAAYYWRQQEANSPTDLGMGNQLENFEAVADALIEGIRNPLRQLESVCYWVLEKE
jgi:ATP-dependent helicase HepA